MPDRLDRAAGEAAFDELAAEYDRQFTDSVIGRLMRGAVWRRCDGAFQPGQRLLDLGCGTGEDALYLARSGIRVDASDASPEMVRVAREKVAAAGLADRVRVEVRDLNRPGGALAGVEAAAYDGAILDFGVVNCLEDLESFAAGLAGCLRPGARALVCAMGRMVPWEWVWYLAQARPDRAFRRLRPGGLQWRGLRVRYPGVRATAASFAPHFVVRRVGAVGALLPPPYTERVTGRVPGLLRALDRIERSLESAPLLPALADHFLLELERRRDDAIGGGAA